MDSNKSDRLLFQIRRDSDKSARLLFQIKIDDIRYSKKQQWNVIYLTLITLAGIISLAISLAIHNLFNPLDIYFLSFSFNEIIIAAVLLVSSAGSLFLIRYSSDIRNYRKSKGELAQKLGLDDAINKKTRTIDFIFNLMFNFMFLSIIIIGFLITIKIIENL